MLGSKFNVFLKENSKFLKAKKLIFAAFVVLFFTNFTILNANQEDVKDKNTLVRYGNRKVKIKLKFINNSKQIENLSWKFQDLNKRIIASGELSINPKQCEKEIVFKIPKLHKDIVFDTFVNYTFLFKIFNRFLLTCMLNKYNIYLL